MTKQFWVNNYYIDVNRNQIQHQQQATSIPPKVLKVLEVLASRAGEVVSHEELMDLVWENSIVGPNTLQRAIANLRKAFGDDSKKQIFIKTHAKKGYSLEANVRWEDNGTEKIATIEPNLHQEQTPTHKTKTKTKTRTIFSAIIASVLAIAFLSIVLWPSETPLFDQVTPLTASDEQEFNASYSPDGKYLVFNRFVGQCESHLWAKDLNNNQEERLSIVPGHYSQLTWSSDGSQLAFVLQSDCSAKPEQGQQCWQLQTLDFAQAWHGNAKNTLRYDCAEIKTTQPTWLNDGRIALLQYPQLESNQAELMIYDAIANTLTKVPHEHAGHIYSLDYSPQTGLLATVSAEKNKVDVLRILTLAGEVQNESKIIRDPNHSVYARFPIKFSADGKHFLTNVDGKVYRLDFDGTLQLMHSPNRSGMWAPSYHPSQTKFAVTLGSKDFDIGYLNTEQASAELEVISRSTGVDVNAKFQPNGALIAFVSLRSGTRQLWLHDNGKTYQLTKFPQGLKSTRYDWSPDGSALVVNVKNQVTIVKLDGSYQTLETPIAVKLVMPWTHQNKLLITDIQAGKAQLFSVDIDTGSTTNLNIEHVLWSAYINDEQLVYLDNKNNFWRYESESARPISMLNNKLLGDYVLPKNNALYGINSQAQLWKFDLETNTLQTIATLDKNITYVSDIKNEQMLATKFIGGRRELVEFSQN
ncbi:winged helix-turn-helix domain-containing protein [Thalassotalea sp. PLHSN55]|uniref:winged helix-turn-helix domain-containing protein n=1 Tax=Thalassotalea sp. PLHSN55 TaxID=3435888 RepID=UPI003F86A730